MPPKKPRLKPGANQGKKPPPPPGGSSTVPADGTQEPEEKKPPTVQELIGGKSWTGKLPQALFYEHCIKAGWQSPDYSMRKEGDKGYISTVYLRTKNPKTLEIEALYFRPPTELPNGLPVEPPPYQPTALEARHYCATYALHRVSSMRNIHLMLPPTHRGFWATFEEIKKQWVDKKRGWMYEADPFLTKREHEAAMVKAQRVAAASGEKPTEKPVDDWTKGWENVPIVDMGSDKRREVEALVRKYHVWNPMGIKMADTVKKETVAKLSSLGFRKVHVEEACEWTKDREEALEWLLVHVPEDDLPEHFLPGNYATGITFSNILDLPLSQEYAAKRLCLNGYSIGLCREVLAYHGGDEALAAESLMHILLHGSPPAPPAEEEEDLISFSDHVTDVWNEEQASLEAIWGIERYTRISPMQFQVKLDIPDHPTKICLDLRKPTAGGWSAEYPNTIPVLSISEEGAKDGPRLPAYVKLSIIRQTAEFAESIKGEPMIFSIVDWVETEFPRILENPGRLRDVSSVITGSDKRRETDLRVASGNKRSGRHDRKRHPIDWKPGHPESVRLFGARAERWETTQQKIRIAARKRLPAWNLQEEIIEAVDSAQVTIISGETGSGKSTQCVQFILDDMILRRLGKVANIICTQPRRISALGLADRVAEERCSSVGEEVGYAIRGESRQKQGTTKITFVTTGVLLRRLQMGDGLEDVSHVFVDEVHERSLDTDFLLILLKRILSVRQDLRVVLMSATLDAEVFSEYFGGRGKVRQVEIQGRMFPVEDFYLDQVIMKTRFDAGGRIQATPAKNVNPEDLRGLEPGIGNLVRGLGDRINYNLIAAIVAHIDEELGEAEGGILIFLPGTMEIQRCLEAIRYVPDGPFRFHTLPLHASLVPAEQRRVFQLPPHGKRKVIAATNVAETSITIEDIVAVIDTGRVKETSYDPENNMVKLLETWASKAACKQRRGRAGRVSAGTCWKLYTRNAEMKMPDRSEPELKRVPLEQTCLGVKHMGVKDVQAFLASALSPPETTAVDGALRLLERMGAIVDGELTALGKHMAMIPADLRCSKLMVYGAMFGCLDSTVTIASILTTRSPFVAPMERREESKDVRVRFGNNQGDLLADCCAFDEWSELRRTTGIREVRRWCDERFLNHHTLMDVASNNRQYIDSLKDIGFLPMEYQMGDYAYNHNSLNDALIRGLIAGAFTPQIARIALPERKFASSSTGAVAVDPESRTIKYFTEGGVRVFLHPSSTLFAATGFSGDAFMSYCTKMGTGQGSDVTSKVFLRECTPINSYSLLLFGGGLEVDTMGRGITVDGWLRLGGWGRIGTLVAQLRMMLDRVLERKIDDPGMDLRGNEVVAIARKLIEGNGI